MLGNNFVQLVPVAQWIARWTSNPKVAGSNPAGDNQISFFSFLEFKMAFDDENSIPN